MKLPKKRRRLAPPIPCGESTYVVRTKKIRLASLFSSLREQGWKPGQVAGWDEEETEHYYRALCDADLRTKSLPLAAVAVELLAAHRPDMVRGIMYLVVSAGFLPDTSDKSYDRVQVLLKNLREKGVVPFEWIVDNVRQTIKPSSWSGLEDFAETVQDAYRLDYWSRLPEYVEIIVEKDTIAGKVASVTREYDVPLHPIRGYSSSSYAWRIAESWKHINKPITVYYLGDHDPSGRNLEEDVHDRLAHYSQKSFRWVRLGVNPEHFEQHDIIALKPKKGDSRYKRFVAKWGPRCAEVEAIPATDLRDMIREAIESHIPTDSWERLQEIEELERQQWADFMEKLSQNGEVQ